jgi:peroxiredoxin Q/BCP
MLKVGDRVPELSASLHDGGTFSTSKLRGKPWVLYFYPKDFTPVCTKEACGFRDRQPDFSAAGAEVFGVSLDKGEKHKAFAESLNLNFPLVVDSGKNISSAFGVMHLWGLLPITKRVTFVVDREGVIRNVIASELNAGKHVDEAIGTLKTLPR